MGIKLLLLSRFYDEVCISGDINNCYVNIIKEYEEFEQYFLNGINVLYEMEKENQKKLRQRQRNFEVFLSLNLLKNKLNDKTDINSTYHHLERINPFFKENIKDIIKNILEQEIINNGGVISNDDLEFLHPELKEAIYGKNKRGK